VMTYHWPTPEGWLLAAFLIGLALMAGGGIGGLVMLAFLVWLSVLSNLLLP